MTTRSGRAANRTSALLGPLVAMAVATTWLASLGGCFDPTYKAGLACDEGACPPGYSCQANVCVAANTVAADGGATLPPDAAPVDCKDDSDCADPEDPCALAGTCEDSVCKFGRMDCSSLDSECGAGVCEAGACVTRAVRETQPCGAGIAVCSGFGACVYDADNQACDEVGEKTRACTDSTCQGGQCITGAAYEDTAECTRDTETLSCGTVNEDDCTACDYMGRCDEQAVKLCPALSCADGACVDNGEEVEVECSRETDGLSCPGPTGAYMCVGGICNFGDPV